MLAAVFFLLSKSVLFLNSFRRLSDKRRTGWRKGCFAVPICIFTPGFFTIIQTFDIPNMICYTWLGLWQKVRFKLPVRDIAKYSSKCPCACGYMAPLRMPSETGTSHELQLCCKLISPGTRILIDDGVDIEPKMVAIINKRNRGHADLYFSFFSFHKNCNIVLGKYLLLLLLMM